MPEDPQLECTANLQGPEPSRTTGPSLSTQPVHFTTADPLTGPGGCVSKRLGTLSCAPAPDGAAEWTPGRSRYVYPRDLRSQTGTRMRPSTVKVLPVLKTLR